MAKIQTYLDKILSAVYGKDVRSSIHDSIKAMNDEVEENREAEKNRIANEERRSSSEKQRELTERERVAEENKRKQAEENRINIQRQMDTSERNRDEAESTRFNEEILRNNAEEERKANERKRVSAENDRLEAEKIRASAEEKRKASEEERKIEYKKRDSEENTRKANEETRKAEEEIRKNNEIRREENFNSLSNKANEKLKKMDDVISGKSVTDKSLSIEGQAADAKETGRRIEETKGRIMKILSLIRDANNLKFTFGERIEVTNMDEGWTPTSDGILQIIVTSKDPDLLTLYMMSKVVNGRTEDDVNSFIYGLQRKGMIFEVSSVPIKKGIQYKTAMKENIENVHLFFYPFETKIEGGN